MQCIASLSATAFVSGAEEKILRTFQAPTTFVENAARLLKDENHGKVNWKRRFSKAFSLLQLLLSSPTTAAIGASVPSLGLSNRQVTATQIVAQSVEATGKLGREDAFDSEAAAPMWHCNARALDGLIIFKICLRALFIRCSHRTTSNAKHSMARGAETVRTWL